MRHIKLPRLLNLYNMSYLILLESSDMLKIIKLRISQCDSSDYLNGILIVMSIFGKQSSFFEEEWQRKYNGNVFEICDTAS